MRSSRIIKFCDLTCFIAGTCLALETLLPSAILPFTFVVAAALAFIMQVHTPWGSKCMSATWSCSWEWMCFLPALISTNCIKNQTLRRVWQKRRLKDSTEWLISEAALTYSTPEEILGSGEACVVVRAIYRCVDRLIFFRCQFRWFDYYASFCAVGLQSQYGDLYCWQRVLLQENGTGKRISISSLGLISVEFENMHGFILVMQVCGIAPTSVICQCRPYWSVLRSGFRRCGPFWCNREKNCQNERSDGATRSAEPPRQLSGFFHSFNSS